ncbi:MAG: sugar transferase [Planctomycetota bacterium]
MLSRRSHPLITLLAVLDAVCATVAFLGAFALRFYTDVLGPAQNPVPLDDYLLALPIVLIVTLVSFAAVGLYRPALYAKSVGRRWAAMARGVLWACLAVLALSALYRQASYSRWVLALYAGGLLLFLPLARYGATLVLALVRLRGKPDHPVLVVGQGEVARTLIEKLRRHPWTGIHVVGTLGLPGQEQATEGVAVSLGTLSDAPVVLGAQRFSEVYLALSLDELPRLAEIEGYLRDTSADLHLVLDAVGLHSMRPEASVLEDLPILTLRGGPGYGWNRFAKRAFDLVGGGLALLILAPVMLTVALAIRLRMGSPVLLRQVRMGWAGRPFVMIKFRSMRNDAEADGAQFATENDDRCTPLGHFLRKYSLDELPQLWNVIKGDMSLVGPRPERPEMLPRIEEIVAHYPLRLVVKAGMTGWAQVNGLRGDLRFAERLRYDLHYVRNWSLAFDFGILIRTAFGGFVGPWVRTASSVDADVSQGTGDGVGRAG